MQARRSGVPANVHPIFGHDNLRIDVGVLLQQVQQIAACQEFDGLAIGELKSRLTVAAGRDQNPL